MTALLALRSRRALALVVTAMLALPMLIGLAPARAAGHSGNGAVTARAVTGAEFRWGLDQESNNLGFAPGTVNFFSAGKIPDPGKGGQLLAEKDWSAQSGQVRIEKVQPGGGYALATWAGLRTDTNGDAMKGTTHASANGFSGHQVVIGGTGWSDPATNRAQIAWTGSFTVVYYSGYTFYYVSDPKLTVSPDGTGTVTATLGGFGTSMDDMSVWRKLSDKKVVLATLTGVHIDGDGGLVTTPAYRGVGYDAPSSTTPQVRSGSDWGSWPKSFVDFQLETGQSSYWYSSGGTNDAYKVPLPITVTADLGDPLEQDPADPTDPVDDSGSENPGGGNSGNPSTGGDDGSKDGTKGSSSSKSFTVKDAQFRWGLDNEANNSAFAPGTYNFFSAGKVANPGKGGSTLSRGGWSARAGKVRIEKLKADGKGYRLATWDGLKTTPAGGSLGAPSQATFSGHQVVIDGGAGKVDPKKKSATITWKGSFTVLFYSGMTFFYVSDPQLVVRKGIGTMTATLGGFGSSMTDTSVWTSLPDTKVVLARLGAVSLKGSKGFTVTPRYREVKYDAPSNISQQLRSGSAWGSWPASFVDYQVRTGQSSYWYSSGGANDAYKVPLPLTVSYDAGRALTPKAPTTSTSDSTASSSTTSTSGTGGSSPSLPTSVPESGAVPAGATTPTTIAPVVTLTAAHPGHHTTADDTARRIWWTGLGVSVLALLVAGGQYLLIRSRRQT